MEVQGERGAGVLMPSTMRTSGVEGSDPDPRMGVRAIDIVRFNWPPYAAAATASIVALSVAIGAPT